MCAKKEWWMEYTPQYHQIMALPYSDEEAVECENPSNNIAWNHACAGGREKPICKIIWRFFSLPMKEQLYVECAHCIIATSSIFDKG